MKRKWVLHIIGQYIIHDSLHQITGYINLCMSTANRQYIFFLISQYTFIHVLYTTGIGEPESFRNKRGSGSNDQFNNLG